ncbi:MAG: hypothetical protein MUO26_04095 [Methanotrichaceae archaeon]|nr:hypothetical protein [Methanotrichaceae archaeon]
MLISFLILFMILATNSYAILDPNEISAYGGESLADKLIEESQGLGSIRLSDSRFPASPKESRSLQENKSLIWTPMPNSLSGSGNTPLESRTISEDQDNAQTSATPAKDNRVAGSWSFELNDTPSKQVVLTLFQIEDAVFGSGSIKDRNNTFVTAASGKIGGEQLDLNIVSIGTIALYRLSMKSNDDSASGIYKIYEASGQTRTGNVQGIRNLPMS